MTDPVAARLAAIEALPEDWDVDPRLGPAPVPDRQALAAARSVVASLREAGVAVDPEDVDADVMGGVAVTLGGEAGRAAWVSLPNGHDGMVIVSTRSPAPWNAVAPLTPATLADAAAYLRGGPVPAWR